MGLCTVNLFCINDNLSHVTPKDLLHKKHNFDLKSKL